MLIFLYLKKSAEQVKVAKEEDLPAVGSLLADSHANQLARYNNKQSTVPFTISFTAAHSVRA
jgi:hypothetical protein